MVKSRSLDAYFADKLANIVDYLQFHKKAGFAAGASGANKRAQRAKSGEANGGEAFGGDDRDDEDLENLNVVYGNARTHRHYELKSMIIRNIEDKTAEAKIIKSSSKTGNASALVRQILPIDPV